MIERYIPYMPLKIKTPKIPFTNIPNPLGAALIYYENGNVKLVPLYYFQLIVKTILKIIAFPFVKLHHRYLTKKYEKMKYYKNKSKNTCL